MYFENKQKQSINKQREDRYGRLSRSKISEEQREKFLRKPYTVVSKSKVGDGCESSNSIIK